MTIYTRPLRTTQEKFCCKKCDKWTYALSTVGYHQGEILESQQERYDKKLCPSCFKPKEKKILNLNK